MYVCLSVLFAYRDWQPSHCWDTVVQQWEERSLLENNFAQYQITLAQDCPKEQWPKITLVQQ